MSDVPVRETTRRALEKLTGYDEKYKVTGMQDFHNRLWELSNIQQDSDEKQMAIRGIIDALATAVTDEVIIFKSPEAPSDIPKMDSAEYTRRFHKLLEKNLDDNGVNEDNSFGALLQGMYPVHPGRPHDYDVKLSEEQVVAYLEQHKPEAASND